MSDLPDNDPLAAVQEKLSRFDFEDALELLDGIDFESLPPKDLGRAVGMGAVCLELTGEDGEQLLEGTMEEFQSEPDCATAAGEILVRHWQLDLAEAVLDVARKAHPKHAQIAHLLGQTLLNLDAPDQALEHLEASLSLAPDDLEPLLSKAECLLQLGRLDDTADIYTQYLDQKPKDADAWVSLAMVRGDQERHKDAVTCFEKANKIEPDSLNVHFNWALASRHAQDEERLKLCTDRLEALVPGDPRALIARGFLHELCGEIWLGWEALSEAHKEAARMEDPHGQQFTAHTALCYLNEHDMQDHAPATVEIVFSTRTFGEEVLAELRRLEGKESKKANDYAVHLNGQINPDLAPPGTMDGDTPLRYERFLRVLAESEKDASRMALEFEQRCGDLDIRVEKIEDLESGIESHVGVWLVDEANVVAPESK
jgi:tetratricopeptide (TPR) repeat protein